MAGITATRIAELAGVGRAAVSNWRRRYPDFPEPIGGTESRPEFDRDEVERWLDQQGRLGPSTVEERVRRCVDGFPSREDAVVLAGVFLLAGAPPDPPTPRRLAADLVAAHGETVVPLIDTLPDSWSAERAELPRAIADLARERGPRDAFEYLCDRYVPGDAPTPAPVAELMATVAGPATTVFDPACGTGRLLSAVRANRRHGQERAPIGIRVALPRILLSGAESGSDIAVGNSLIDDRYPDLLADVVVCDPPFGERGWGRDELAYDSRWAFGGLPPRTEPELAWVQHCLAHAVPGGRVVMLMPRAAASRLAGRRIRAELVRQGALLAVLGPPRGPHVWVLRRPSGPEPGTRVLFAAGDHDELLRAWHEYEAGAVARPSARVVPVLDLLDDEVDLDPATHLTAGQTHDPRRVLADLAYLEAGLESVRNRLPALALRPSGAEAPARAAVRELVQSGAVRILGPGRTGAGGESRLRSGDVLVTSTGGAVVARVATDDQHGAEICTGVRVVRADPAAFDSWFLAGALSAAGRAGGVSTSTSGGRDVRRLRVPVLPLDEQRKLGAVIRRLSDVNAGLAEAAERGNAVVRDIVAALVGGALEADQPDPR